MKFELLVALKYLIPRWRQLSVSIISLISILVVSLVVWLAIVFLSISDGIQKRWIDGFVALNAPLKVTPTEEYYNSYYHQIDRYAFASNFSTKSLVQKLNAAEGSAYDPDLDQELPYSFPQNENKDLVKEAWHSVDNLSGARAQIAQVSLCNMKLNIDGSFLSQLCYVTAQDSHNQRMAKRLVAPNRDDIDYFLHKLPGSKESFLKSVQIQTLQTVDYEHPFFAPSEGVLNGCKVFFPTGQQKIIIPQSEARLAELTAYLKRTGFEVEEVAVAFESGKPSELCEITFDRHIDFDAKLLNAETGSFEVSSQIQGITVSGISHLNHLEVVDAAISSGKSCWAYQENGELLIPSDPTLGDGVLLSSSYKDKGVKLGSRGYLSFMSSSSTAVQEQKTPVYVAGFFDPGMVPMANKLLFVSPDLMAAFDGNLSLPDQMFANGINVWLDNPNDVLAAKRALIQELEARGVANYWNVESFYDFEFSRPILQQFDSDKTLFTLIMIIILVVACSNIISMLILLVNDKKREIGILQALGASPKRIGIIFGMCGLITGLVSSLLGTLLALLTLKNLQSLVNFLNMLRGHETFQKMFFGGQLPNEVSVSALAFVLTATIMISILAGLVPALKAARIRPSEILRGEG